MADRSALGFLSSSKLAFALALLLAVAHAKLVALGGVAPLLAGLPVLAFWAAAALRVGGATAERVNPDARAPEAALYAFLYGYGFIVMSVAVAGAAQRIDMVSLTVLAGVGMLASPAPRQPWPGWSASSVVAAVRREPVAAGIVLGITTLTLLNVAWAILLPPFAFDDFTYHLVFPTEWMQTGTLNMRAVPFGNHSPSYYPMNTELFFTWLLLPLRSVSLLTASQCIFLGMSVLALFALFRRCGASSRASLVAASLYGVCPLVIEELAKAYVDIAFGCFFLLALHAALTFGERPSLARWLQFAFAVALFAGTKIPGVVFTLLLLLPIMAVVGLRTLRAGATSQRASPGRIVVALLSAAGVLLAGGGWWYVRNLVVAANPVFPLHVELLGFELFPGAYDRAALPASHFSTLLDLYGPAVLAILVCGALASVYLALTASTEALPTVDAVRPDRERRADAQSIASTRVAAGGRAYPRSALALSVGLPALISLISVYLLPFDSARFVMVLCGLSGGALLLPLDDPRPSVRRGVEILIVVALVLATAMAGAGRESLLLALRFPHLAGDVVVWGAFALAGLWLTLIAARFSLALNGRGKLVAGTAAAVLALVVVAAAEWLGRPDNPLRKEVHTVFVESSEPYAFLNEHYRDVSIAATGSNLTFRLQGANLGNRVRYVNVFGAPDWLFHDFVANFRGDPAPHRRDRRGVFFFRGKADFEAWRANLAAADSELLFVKRLAPGALKRSFVRDAAGFPVESIWAEQHPELFRRVYASSLVRIYEILD